MNVYYSKSSALVKIITAGTLIVLTLVTLILLTSNRNYGLIGGIILSVLIISTIASFYANSLDKIILEKERIVLKKNIGQIEIPKSDIIEASQLEYSNLTMTYGSKGVFGFIGNTMDNSVSFVKDRKNMIRISTRNKKYILSSEKPGELLRDIVANYTKGA